MDPLIVNSLPRSGTTAMMHYLSKHPSLVTHPKYPYETRYATWVWHSLNILPQRQLDNSVEHHWTFQQHEDHAERNPWFGIASDQRPYFKGDGMTAFHEAARQITTDFYRHLAREQDKPNAVRFCEKFPGSTRAILEKGYPNYREVFILRDPRDTFLSSKQFNEKRDRSDFGQDKFDNDKDYLEYVVTLTLNAFRRAKKQPNTLIITFEELSTQPTNALNRVLAFCGLDPVDDAFIKAAGGVGKQHSTSKKTVLGRFESEATAELREAAAAFDNALSELGYE